MKSTHENQLLQQVQVFRAALEKGAVSLDFKQSNRWCLIVGRIECYMAWIHAMHDCSCKRNCKDPAIMHIGNTLSDQMKTIIKHFKLFYFILSVVNNGQ